MGNHSRGEIQAVVYKMERFLGWEIAGTTSRLFPCLQNRRTLGFALPELTH